jgi:hypothetical protein
MRMAILITREMMMKEKNLCLEKKGKDILLSMLRIESMV